MVPGRKNREGKIWKTFMQRRPSPDNDGHLGFWASISLIGKTGEPLEFIKTEKKPSMAARN